MKKGFTLAEIMIVLSVIAVLTAILLPAARNATPNENILKFKKAHTALNTAVRELVNSDKYYLNGDLGVRPNANLIDGSHDGDTTYLCSTLADVFQVKKAECTETNQGTSSVILSDNFNPSGWDWANFYGTPQPVTSVAYQTAKGALDNYCKVNQSRIEPQIETSDGVFIWDNKPAVPFGVTNSSLGGKRNFSSSDGESTLKDESGNDIAYKIICIDIDEWNESEDPFGYGVRADGKILNGARADEWLEKNIQDKD